MTWHCQGILSDRRLLLYTCLLRSPACRKNANQPQSQLPFASCMQKYAFQLSFSFIFNPGVSNFHHPNGINLVIRHQTGFKNVIYASFDQDLGLTKADKVASLHPQADIYHTYPDVWHWEGQAELVSAIKAPLSPVPPRHPWRRRARMWAGNLSGCRLALTLKSTPAWWVAK